MTAAHSTATFDYYLTDDDYDSTQPLTRDMLDLAPFASFDMGGAKPDHTMTHEVTLPERTGRQMILSVWNIADTVNAFYSCVDVDFGGPGGGEETPTADPTSDTPTEKPTGGTGCDASVWDTAAVYTAGDEVTHDGTAYSAGWWTTGEKPGTTGEWGVWKQTAAC